MVYSTGTYGGFISELDVNITGDASNWTLFQYSPCSDESLEMFRVSTSINLAFLSTIPVLNTVD